MSTALSPRPAAAAPASGGEPVVERIDDPRRFGELRDEWNDLWERASSADVFTHHDWLTSWWEAYGDTASLQVLLAREDGRAVAALPLCRAGEPVLGLRRPVLRFVGGEQADRMDALVEPGREAGLDRILESLRRDLPRWHHARLERVPVGSELAARIQDHGPDGRLVVHGRPASPCPYLPLASTWEETWKTLKPRMRKNIRRRDNGLRRAGQVSMERWRGTSLTAEALARAARIDRKGWKGSEGCSVFAAPSLEFHEALVRRLAADGVPELFLLRLDDTDLAYMYGFHHPERYLYYSSGFDEGYARFSPGLVLMQALLQALVAEGVKEFDFLRGGEGYKSRWTELRRETTDLLVLPRTRLAPLWSLLLFHARVAAARAKDWWRDRRAGGTATGAGGSGR